MHNLKIGAIVMTLLLISVGLFSNVYGEESAWVVVKEWAGSNSKTTENFYISSDYWSIIWSATIEPELSHLSGTVYINVYDQNGKYVQSMNSDDTGGDFEESYIRGSGTFYLDIDTLFVDWKIFVRQVAVEDVEEDTTIGQEEQVTGESYSAGDVKIIKEWKGTGMPKSTKLFTLKSPTWIIWSSRILPQYDNVEFVGRFSISV